jgi:hypothetical protein
LDWITLGTAVIISLLINKFLPAYFSEKGKNLATKEDVSLITEKIEKIKSIYSNEDKVLEKKRQIYEEIVSSLKIFISGHGISKEQKEKFYEAYASAWLWAPDSVLSKLNIFIEQQIKYAEKKEVASQEIMKKQYGDIVLSMRKDVGFIETKVISENYVFATFDN